MTAVIQALLSAYIGVALCRYRYHQLFTDVYGAKRVGIHNILVKPIHPKEEIQIVLKRKLEKIVVFFYAKEQRKRKNS